MATQAGLKAGGIGAGVLALLALLGFIPVPFLGCLCCLVVFGAMIGDGVLAAYFMPAPRATGAAAGTGALAGVLAGAGYGLISGIGGAIQTLVFGASSSSSYLTPDVVKQLQDAGVSPEMFTMLTGTVGGMLGVGMCCIGSLVIGAVLGAIGGAIGAAVIKN